MTYEGGLTNSNFKLTRQNIPDNFDEGDLLKGYQKSELGSIDNKGTGNLDLGSDLIDSENDSHSTNTSKLDLVTGTDVKDLNSSEIFKKDHDTKNVTSDIASRLYQENLVLRALLHHIASTVRFHLIQKVTRKIIFRVLSMNNIIHRKIIIQFQLITLLRIVLHHQLKLSHKLK